MKSKKLSPFVFAQQTYDYLTNQLSTNDQEKYENKLKVEKDCQDHLASMKKAYQFCNSLSEGQAQDIAIENLKSYNKSLLFYIVNPSYIKWPISLFAFKKVMLALIVAVISYTIVPWSKLSQSIKQKNSQQSYKLLAIETKKTFANKELMAVRKKPEGVSKEVQELASSSWAKKKKLVVLKKDIPIDDVAKKPTKIIKPKDLALSKPIVQKQETQSPHLQKEKIETQTNSVQKRKRFRFYMSLHDLDKLTPKIVKIIQDLGGVKGGSVKLGHVKPKGRYFHIKLPVDNRNKLRLALLDYGVVRVEQEPYQVKGDENSDRVILWVEDLDLKVKRLQNR